MRINNKSFEQYNEKEYRLYAKTLRKVLSKNEEIKQKAELVLDTLCKCDEVYICPVCSLRKGRKSWEKQEKVILN